MKSIGLIEIRKPIGTMKVQVSTSIEEEDWAAVQRIVDADDSHAALVLRKAIMRGLPLLQREVFGFERVPPKAEEVTA